MSKYHIEDDEVRKYFHQEYSRANFRVVPGHWPNFKTKEEVDDWFELMVKLGKDLLEQFNEDKNTNILSFKGDESLLYSQSKFVGVIGSRKATKEELAAAHKLSQLLVKKGYIVVSGLAIGVDTEAHKGAIDGGGKTIAIVSTSPDEKIYPRENTSLAMKIIRNGLIVYPYDSPARWAKGFGQPQKRLIERDILLAYLCPRIVAVSDSDYITGGTAWALNYGYKYGKELWRVDSNLQFYKNPNFKKKTINWNMEIDLDLMDNILL